MNKLASPESLARLSRPMMALGPAMLLAIAGLCCPGVMAAESGRQPWNEFSPYYGAKDDAGYYKDIRWGVCSRMAISTNTAAGGIQDRRNDKQMYSEADISRLLYAMYPVDGGDYQDVVNQKLIDLAYQYYQSYKDDIDHIVIEQAAWDWCSRQDPANFSGL